MLAESLNERGILLFGSFLLRRCRRRYLPPPSPPAARRASRTSPDNAFTPLWLPKWNKFFNSRIYSAPRGCPSAVAPYQRRDCSSRAPFRLTLAPTTALWANLDNSRVSRRAPPHPALWLCYPRRPGHPAKKSVALEIRRDAIRAYLRQVQINRGHFYDGRSSYSRMVIDVNLGLDTDVRKNARVQKETVTPRRLDPLRMLERMQRERTSRKRGAGTRHSLGAR